MHLRAAMRVDFHLLFRFMFGIDSALAESAACIPGGHVSKSVLSFDPSSYATVADRITLFYERFPSGRIQTELVSRVDGEITFKALVFRDVADAVAAASGWASERENDGEINAVACLENTETSAIGRALANLGFTASLKRPSLEEMQKAERAKRRRTAAPLSLHREADAAQDLLGLLETAERRGFSVARLRVIRRRTGESPAIGSDRLLKIESLLRSWLRRRSS
jgi:hypothetical protein